MSVWGQITEAFPTTTRGTSMVPTDFQDRSTMNRTTRTFLSNFWSRYVQKNPKQIRRDIFGSFHLQGWTEEDLSKLANGNLIRVWKEVERVKGQLQNKMKPGEVVIDPDDVSKLDKHNFTQGGYQFPTE